MSWLSHISANYTAQLCYSIFPVGKVKILRLGQPINCGGEETLKTGLCGLFVSCFTPFGSSQKT